MTSIDLPTAEDIVTGDLGAICDDLSVELAQLAGKRLLITGGAGFLGYYLVKTALHHNERNPAAPIDVTVWDNFIRGRPTWLDDLSADACLHVEQVDLIDPLPATMPDFQWIIHAAGIASPPFYRKYPLKTIDANINGLRNLLDYSVRQSERAAPVEGFLFYSSSEIYGDPSPDAIPTTEEYRGLVSCTGPRACYDESKRFGETICVVFAQEHGIPTKMARPFNNYGPGLKISDRRVIPDFARDTRPGATSSCIRTGARPAPSATRRTRSRATTRCSSAVSRASPTTSGTETPEISMADLAEKVIEISRELTGYSGRLIRQPNPESVYLVDNPNRRCPDISKSRTQLGYEPKVGLDDGVRRTLLWYLGNPEADEA